MNLSRTDTAYFAEQACQIFEDAEQQMIAKMLQEFKFCDDIKQLCKDLCELPAFRYWKPKELERKFEDAKENRNQAQITQGPYAGYSIFGGAPGKG